MSFFENTRKPVGFGGKIMVAMMNVGHSAVVYSYNKVFCHSMDFHTHKRFVSEYE